MVTVVFVHGTGVRQKRYLDQFELLTSHLAGLDRDDVRLQPCLWGDDLGATLAAGGASVPGGTGDTEDIAAEWPVARWRLLAWDPLHEVRVLAVQYSANEPPETVPGAVAYHQRLERAARTLADQQPVQEALRSTELADFLSVAVAAVLQEDETRLAMRRADERIQGAELIGALARAFVAEAANECEVERGWPPLMSGAHRDTLVTAIEAVLGGQELGMSEKLVSFSGRMAMRMGGARALERRRHALLLAHHPMAGDVLRYLSRGQQIRDYIGQTLRGIPGEIMLLAHSLGGIAALDLLITEKFEAVRTLVTVGSQGPLLYELGALPSLGFGSPLPLSVPHWVNIYDPRDLLAYVGSAPRLFGDRVHDIPVDNGCSFPDAHSNYFDNPEFYRILDRFLP
jgi:hypothetical protein